jgi:predicted dehydrogenase
MSECGFPVIPEYLGKQQFPRDSILGVEVTHIWTQSAEISSHIAKAAKIKNVVTRIEDLIGKVDAVLLARDDAEMHLEMARPFLVAGLPIYIDKPLALSESAAKEIISLQAYPGQLFSCSALRYASELWLTEEQQKSIGKILTIQAHTPNDWDKYSIHVIEPALKLLPERGRLVKSSGWKIHDRTTLFLDFEGGVELQISSFGEGKSPLGMRVIGDKGYCDLIFSNPFCAFKSALEDFIAGIRECDTRISSEHMLETVRLIELGR